MEMRARVAQMSEKIHARVVQATYIETEIEATECKRRTPVDTGALRDSIFVPQPQTDGNTIHTDIFAGGPSAPYAVTVHEDLEAFHKVGQAKFVESVLRESVSKLAGRISRRVRSGLSLTESR